MHDRVPRFDAQQGMKQVTNVFGADLMGVDRPYFTAVLSVAGAYFAIGIISFFIFALVFVSYSCCRPKFRKLPVPGCCAKLFGCIFNARLWSLAAALAMLGGTSACLAIVSSFRTATDNSVTQIKAVSSLVGNVTAATNGALTPALSAAVASAASLYTAATNFSDSAFTALVTEVQTGIVSTNTSVSDYAGKLTSLNTAVQKVVSGDFDISTLGTKVFLGGIISLGAWRARRARASWEGGSL